MGEGLDRARRAEQLRRELARAEHKALLEMRKLGKISDEVFFRVVEDLDLEHVKYEPDGF